VKGGEEKEEKGMWRRRRRKSTFVADNLRILILPMYYQFYPIILFFICIVRVFCVNVCSVWA
jgi:hypothetical protein